MLMRQPIFRFIDDLEWLCCKFIWYWCNLCDRDVWYW